MYIYILILSTALLGGCAKKEQPSNVINFNITICDNLAGQKKVHLGEDDMPPEPTGEDNMPTEPQDMPDPECFRPGI